MFKILPVHLPLPIIGNKALTHHKRNWWIGNGTGEALTQREYIGSKKSLRHTNGPITNAIGMLQHFHSDALPFYTVLVPFITNQAIFNQSLKPRFHASVFADRQTASGKPANRQTNEQVKKKNDCTHVPFRQSVNPFICPFNMSGNGERLLFRSKAKTDCRAG